MATFEELLAQQTALTPPSNETILKRQKSGTELFIQSALEGIPEFIGVEPSAEVRQYRNDNPVSGLVSELATPLGVYGGFFKATKVLGKASRAGKGPKLVSDFTKRLDSSADASPILTGVVKEAVRFAPLEAARLGGAALAGGDIQEVAGEGAFNLALGGVLGGAGGLLRAAGPRLDKLDSLLPKEIDRNAPPTLQLRQAKALKDKIEPEHMEVIQRQLSKAIRLQQLGENGRYVKHFELGGKSGDINRLFKNKDTKSLARKRLIVGENAAFKDKAELTSITDKAKLPADWEELVEFPRYIKGKTAKTARTTNQTIASNMFPVEDSWYLAKESEGGLFVMAKKLDHGEWLMFKTDQPGKFVPTKAGWADRAVNKAAWEAGATGTKANAQHVASWGRLQRLAADVPLQQYGAVAAKGFGSVGAKMKESLKKSELGEGLFHMQSRVADFFLEHASPTMFQFRNNARASRIMALSRETFDHANDMTHRLLFGQVRTEGKPLKEMFLALPGDRKILNGPSVEAMIKTLNKEDLSHITKVYREQIPLEEVLSLNRQGELSDGATAFLTRMDELDGYMTNQVQSAQELAGRTPFEAAEGHFGLSRTWLGKNRVSLLNEEGATVHIASGRTNREAMAEAKAVMADLNAQGKEVSIGRQFSAERTDDFEIIRGLDVGSDDFRAAQKASAKHIRAPKFTEERKNVGGFIGEQEPFSGKELQDVISQHYKQMNRHVAELAIDTELAGEFEKLALEDPRIFNQLRQRIDDLAGRPGPFAQIQNKAVDKVLAPILGVNSATKIAGAANTAVFHLQLGLGNTMFPVLNALTFMQTVLPQAAFVMGAPYGKLAKYYSTLPAGGPDGLPRKAVGFLSPIKVTAQGFKELRKPTEEGAKLWQRALSEGVIDPRAFEEFVGEGSKASLTLREALSGKDGFGGMIKAVSEFLPAKSEQFARAHSFTTGMVVGRDVMGLTDDALYRFSKQFTHNTMFLYGTADRARMITGPMGSMFGMFKNWQMHYMGWMLEYAGEASKGNFAPLLWMNIGTGLTGGVGALPLAGPMAKLFTNESLIENVYGSFGGAQEDPTFSDAIYMGLPAFAGVSMQGSAAAPFADPVRDATMLTSFVHWDRMKALGTAVGAAMDAHVATGDHPIQSPEILNQFIRALAPRSMFRTAQVLEGEYMKSLSTGYPQLKLSPMERTLFAAGFNPIRVERAYKASDLLWNDQEKLRNQIQTFGKLWHSAERQGDYKELDSLLEDMLLEGVPVDSVMRSAETRRNKSEVDLFRNFDVDKVLEKQFIIGPR